MAGLSPSSLPLSLSLKPRLHEAARLLGFLMQSLVLLDCRGTKFKASDYDTHLKYDRERKKTSGKVCANCELQQFTRNKVQYNIGMCEVDYKLVDYM